MDGVLVAGTGEQFFNSQLAAPVNRDQNEQAVSPNTRVWVGSMSDNCNDWSGGGGGGVQGRTVEVGDSEFLAGTEAHTCGENNRLFCISQAGEP
jgi:hypothetical protein